MSYLLFAILGLGTGAIYAALTLGLILVHRGSGVVNFAYGAMAMVVAYAFVQLRATGELEPPFPGVPSLQLDPDGLSFWPAFAIAIALAAALGYAVHLLMTKLLRGAPPLAKVVAAVGVMVVLQAGAVHRYGSTPPFVEPILPNGVVEVLDQPVPRDRFLLAAIVLVLAAVLAALFRRTRTGLAIAAAAEDERSATLLGWSPDRLAALTWVGGTVLAGVVAVLVTPISSLDPTLYTLLIVPALGAALLARFRSFGAGVAAAFGIGIAQSVLVNATARFDLLADLRGLQQGLPFLVVVVALVVSGASLPQRGAVAAGRLPRAPSPRTRRPIVATGVAVGLGGILLTASNGGWRYALITSMVAGLLCLSLVVLTGFTGQLSLAQMTFAGIAGFTLSKYADGLGLPFPIAPLLAAATAAVVGLVVGLPAIRVRGANLAIVTLALSVAVEEFLFKNPSFSGGFEGSPVPRPSFAGIDLGIAAPGGRFRLAFAFLALAVLAVSALAVVNLRRSGTGRAMLAVRANERAAAAAGVDVAATKLLAFVYSAFLAGLAGTLLAYQQAGGSLSFDAFGVFASLTVLTAAYLGGITTVSGAVLGGAISSGAIVFYALGRWIDGFHEYELMIGGIALIATAARHPEGIGGGVAIHLQHLLRRRAPVEPPPEPAAVPAADPAPVA